MRLEEKTLFRIQALSGLAFALFLALHLINAAVGAGGQSAYDGFQASARAFYQNPAVELALVALAASIHAWAGIARWLRRRAAHRARASAGRNAGSPRPPWRIRLHRWSGYYLLATVGGHFLATRGVGLWTGRPVDFAYLHFSLSHWGWVFYPYYVLLGVGGAFHLLHGCAISLKILGARLPAWTTAPRSRAFWAASAAAGLAICAGIAAMGGAWHPVDTRRFAEYRALYERILPAALLPWRPGAR